MTLSIDSTSFNANWNALKMQDLPDSLIAELSKEIPDKQLLIQWLRAKFNEVWGSLQLDEDNFMQWLQFQYENSELPLFFRKWPRLQPIVHVNFSSKISSIMQRHCSICEGAIDQHSNFPIFVLPLRIRGRSRQSLSTTGFHHYQRVIREHFDKRYLVIPPEGGLCLTLTFVLNQRSKDRDVDNMSKAFMDSFSRALGFNDARIHHLNAVKLLFPDVEESVYARLQPSHINSEGNFDVAVPKHHMNWAGQERLD